MKKSQLKSKIRQALPVGMSVMLLDARSGELPAQRAMTNTVRRAMAALTIGPGSTVAGSALHPVRAIVTDRFDAWDARARALTFATEAFTAAGIEYGLMPERHGGKMVVLRGPDQEAAVRAMAERADLGQAWHLSDPGTTHNTVDLAHLASHRSRLSSLHGRYEFTLFNHQIDPSGRVFGGPHAGVLLSFWKELTDDRTPRPDGETFEPGTLMAPTKNGIASYLSPLAWRNALESPERWPITASLPHIYEITEPIDVVYTWVDGDDPAWQRRKNEALGITDEAQLNDTAANASRFTSRDELRYSLRSIEMYANWVRNIYIVTDDQVPAWLDTSNPRIHVVSHRDIFTDSSVLPVFNSHAIESQLHHIEGLSNQFIYMNDDVLFGQIASPSDFFLNSRLSKYFPSNATLDVDPPSTRDLPVLSAAKNARALIAEEFGVTITNKFKHTPIALQRDVLAEMEERFADMFSEVSASRFRHPSDFSITSGLYHYYAFATTRAVPGSITYGYQDLSREDMPFFLRRLIRMNPYKVFCLNDTDSSPDAINERTPLVLDMLQTNYPFRSTFELAADATA